MYADGPDPGAEHDHGLRYNLQRPSHSCMEGPRPRLKRPARSTEGRTRKSRLLPRQGCRGSHSRGSSKVTPLLSVLKCLHFVDPWHLERSSIRDPRSAVRARADTVVPRERGRRRSQYTILMRPSGVVVCLRSMNLTVTSAL